MVWGTETAALKREKGPPAAILAAALTFGGCSGSGEGRGRPGVGGGGGGGTRPARVAPGDDRGRTTSTLLTLGKC